MKFSFRIAVLALAAAGPVSAGPASAEALPGYDQFDLMTAHRARPVAASVWYPAAGPTYRAPIGAGPIFESTMAYMGPAVAEGTHPLVLLSHGSGGNADTLGWVSAALALRGAIVLAVNHPGSTSGDSSPRRSVDLGARARDLSAALDLILSDPAFAAHVDAERIGVIGFSLGGATALGMIGIRFNGAAQDALCAARPAAADCGFFLRGGVRFTAAPGFAADAFDPRIARAVAVDPGFGGAVTTKSLERVAAAVTLVNLGEIDRLPAVDVGPGGNDLAARLPGAEYTVISPASHFTFLAPCRPSAAAILAEEGEDPICTDPKTVDRRATHTRLVEVIATGLGLDEPEE